MKKIFVFIVILSMLGCFDRLFAESKVYHNEKQHFSFMIPDGWSRAAEKDIRSDESRIEGELANSGMYVEVARRDELLKRDDKSCCGAPYMAIYYQYSFNSVHQGIIDDIKSGKIVSSPVKVGIGEKETDTYDEARNILISAKQAGQGITNFQVSLLGDNRVVQIGFAASGASYDDDLKAFNLLLDSFKFDDGYTYR